MSESMHEAIFKQMKDKAFKGWLRTLLQRPYADSLYVHF
jgi:hypothetical protein